MKQIFRAITVIALAGFLTACGGNDLPAAVDNTDIPTAVSDKADIPIDVVDNADTPTVTDNDADTPPETVGAVDAPPEKSTGKMYLYGEQHGEEAIMKHQLELWGDYYINRGMRHLFVEYPYFTAEFLNIWMQADDDDILDRIYNDVKGTPGHVPYTKVFYKTIKEEYPETIFVGTDVGHQYATTGARFMRYLEDIGLKDSEMYLSAQQSIRQGEIFVNGRNDKYREEKMTENFIREFDKLGGKDIMGIYGAAHTQFGNMNMRGQTFPTMAEGLKERYGENLHTESLVWLAYVTEPIDTAIITVGGKKYEATCFGEQDLRRFNLDFASRVFWRLENAYDDFKDNHKPGDKLPYDNYPMTIEVGQVFLIDYTTHDGEEVRMYYRSDGNDWQGMGVTEQFIVEE